MHNTHLMIFDITNRIHKNNASNGMDGVYEGSVQYCLLFVLHFIQSTLVQLHGVDKIIG